MKWPAVPLLCLCLTRLLGAVEIKPPELALAKVRRIYVDQLGGGKESDQLRDMIVTALQNAGLFVITENPDRADAALKGSGDDKIYTEQHNTSESIGMHAGDSSGTRAATSIGTATSSNQSMSAGITDHESSNIQERRHESRASVRLVTADGDVIWSTTQESNGAKFRGAMADVADKIARRLIEETQRARALALATKPAPGQAPSCGGIPAIATSPLPDSGHSPEKSSSYSPGLVSGPCPSPEAPR
jgi:hypothetical protein